MILAQFALLYVCLLYRPRLTPHTIDPRSTQESAGLTGRRTQSEGGKPEPPLSNRPGNLWQWENFGTYLEFVALLVAGHCCMYLVFHWSETYVTILGFLALGLEATVSLARAEAHAPELTKTRSSPFRSCW